MPKYQPVFSQIWKDNAFQELSKDGKLLFLYLITNESINNSGIYQMTIKTISQETGIPSKTVLELFTKGSLKNVTYDQENSYVFIHKRRIYSPGGSPEKVKKGIQKEYELSRCSSLWGIFNSLYLGILKGFPNGSGTVPKGFVKGSPTVQDSPSLKEIGNGSPTVPEGLGNPSLPLPLALPIDSNVLLNNKPLKMDIEKRVLDDLIQKSGKKFKPTETNLKIISARLAEEYTEEDLLSVNSNQCREWLGDPKMEKYIRPETIYAKKKIGGYVNNREVSLKQEKTWAEEYEEKKCNQMNLKPR